MFLTLNGAARAQVASGAPYTLEQSVIASGGGASSGGAQFTVTGAIGQSVADASGGAAFDLRSGFFTAAPPLAPTAALVFVGGRARTESGRGIRGVVVTMTGGDGATRTAFSGAGGYFHFADVPAGDTYVLRARAKRFDFAQNIRVVYVAENIDDIEFTAFL